MHKIQYPKVKNGEKIFWVDPNKRTWTAQNYQTYSWVSYNNNNNITQCNPTSGVQEEQDVRKIERLSPIDPLLKRIFFEEGLQENMTAKYKENEATYSDTY